MVSCTISMKFTRNEMCKKHCLITHIFHSCEICVSNPPPPPKQTQVGGGGPIWCTLHAWPTKCGAGPWRVWCRAEACARKAG